MTSPVLELPRVRRVYDETTRRTTYERQCDRCPTWRTVRDPRARMNLCLDCAFVLSPSEKARWAA